MNNQGTSEVLRMATEQKRGWMCREAFIFQSSGEIFLLTSPFIEQVIRKDQLVNCIYRVTIAALIPGLGDSACRRYRVDFDFSAAPDAHESPFYAERTYHQSTTRSCLRPRKPRLGIHSICG